jgi:hypothetical protein
MLIAQSTSKKSVVDCAIDTLHAGRRPALLAVIRSLAPGGPDGGRA